MAMGPEVPEAFAAAMRDAARLAYEAAREAARHKDAARKRAEAATPNRRRLPIYGERKIDEVARRAVDDYSFGVWLAERREALDLVTEIDHHMDLGYTSVDDVDALMEHGRIRWRGDAIADDDHAELLCYRDDYSLLRARWIRLYVNRFLSGQTTLDEIDHRPLDHVHAAREGAGRCEEYMPLPPPMEPPDAPGVYALLGLPGFVKIGKAKSIVKRMRELQCGCPVPLKLIAVLSKDPGDEGALHKRWAPYRETGEWFRTETPLRSFIREKRYGEQRRRIER